ncbi:MAG: carbohydrate porin, partial [Terrimicrobiaceae bacterium]|nr:carbohydrate porin [Terrimicrobiaceae bacterium]
AMRCFIPWIALAAAVSPALRAESSRFLVDYLPIPSNHIGSRDWWAGPSFSGDWWGARNRLEQAGIEFPLSYTNNIAGNPTGGLSQGFTYCDNLSFGISLDFEKLAGVPGLSATASALNRAGSSLSEKYIGNQFTVQQVYGGQTFMFYGWDIRQRLWDGRLSLKVGRFATGDDFASSPIYWLYMNNGIDGNPQALPVNTVFSAYPWAVWAARLEARPHPDLSLKAGIYQVSNRVFDRAYHGMDWSIRSGDGALLISQLGWSPSLFGAKAKDAKSAARAGLPGNYWFGAYWSPWDFPQFGTDTRASNSYGFYWHADQMVFREPGSEKQGLTLWSAFVLSPQQNIAKLPFQANGGLVYEGLLPGRDADQAVFGFAIGKFSRDYASATASTGGGYPDTELVLEWGYII